MNKIVLVGRLTQDVELRYSAGSGQAVGTFTVAVDREFADKSGKRETDFIDVQVWGKQAENCSNYIGKGSLVSVSGSLRIEKYDGKDGIRRTSARVNADRVNFLSSNSNRPSNAEFEPIFEPSFSAIDDDDCPF